jgi:histone H2A
MPRVAKRIRVGTNNAKGRRSGVNFPVLHIRRLMRQHRRANVHPHAAIFASAVLEYLTAELLESSAQVTSFAKKKVITPRFIKIAMHQDNDFVQYIKGVIIRESGNVPYIENFAPRKKPAKRTNKKKTSNRSTERKSKSSLESHKQKKDRNEDNTPPLRTPFPDRINDIDVNTNDNIIIVDDDSEENHQENNDDNEDYQQAEYDYDDSDNDYNEENESESEDVDGEEEQSNDFDVEPAAGDSC